MEMAGNATSTLVDALRGERARGARSLCWPLRRIAIVTESLPPATCGIGDHTLRLAAALRELGHEVIAVARQGLEAPDVAVFPGALDDEWTDNALGILGDAGVDHLVLQYTPLLFSKGRMFEDRSLLAFWRAAGRRFETSLIVHESYYRTWRWPPSLVRGSAQKALLRRLAREADHVFTASEPLIEELGGWRLARPPVLLPIGSNVPFKAADVASLRHRYGLASGEVVLTLFGGGTSLKWMAPLVDRLGRELTQAGLAHCWLLLGGIDRGWFDLSGRVVDPGWLDFERLSAHLQLTDVFLVPHAAGLCAKRGTAIAALEHGLPVAGTIGPSTDGFWADMPGVRLSPGGDAAAFARLVVELCRDPRRGDLGIANTASFHATFSWPRIARSFSGAIARD